MKIAYKIQVSGQATDLRFVGDDYIASSGEIIIEGDSLPEINTLHSLDYLKQEKIAESKIEASRRINETLPDWMVNRHRDQIELGVNTTLSAEEYKLKQYKRQAVRDASNTIEAEILAISDSATCLTFDVVNHSAWPV